VGKKTTKMSRFFLWNIKIADIMIYNFKLIVMRLLGYLPERSISADELQLILEEIFRKYDTVFDEWKSSQVSTLRRLIRIYDFLKYGENKTP